MRKLLPIYIVLILNLPLIVSAREIPIPEWRVSYHSQSIGMSETAIGQWVSHVKAQVNSEMLNPQGAMQAWLTKYGSLSDYERHLLSYFVEVQPLAGTDRVYLALFYSRLHMNKTLIRSSLFQDGGPGVQTGVVPRGNELFLHESMEAARGLNLRGERIRTMFDLSVSQGVSLYTEEKAFADNILPILEERHPKKDYYIIAFNVAGFSLDTLGHEVAHSLYDTLSEYKAVVNHFWKNVVSKQDRAKIRLILKEIYSSEEVIIDEFQAYLLQPKVPAPQSELLAEFVPKYMMPLIEALNAKNLPLPTLQSGCDSAL